MITIDETHAQRTVSARVGETVEINLAGNLTTGYTWSLQSLNQEVLAPVGKMKYHPHGRRLGAGGRFILRLAAARAGETWVELAYRRPFESAEAPSAAEFKVLVQVAASSNEVI